MPRYNVKMERDGQELWACFSSIVDAFITEFMDKDSYEAWRIKEYQYTTENYKPAEECNVMTLGESLFTLGLNKSDNEIIENMREAGILSENNNFEDNKSEEV